MNPEVRGKLQEEQAAERTTKRPGCAAAGPSSCRPRV